MLCSISIILGYLGARMKHKEVASLIKEHLMPEQEVLEYTVKSLDSGDLHFSSDVQEVHLQLQEKKDTTKLTLLQLVVKAMLGKEKQIENSSKIGFLKEIAFYKLTAPEYTEVQEKHNFEINNFPKLFAETNDIIVLSDLRCLKYSSCKQRLDEVHTQLVLSELAKFHATGVALKLCKTGYFQSKLTEVVTPGLRNATSVNRDERNSSFRGELSSLLKSMEEFKSIADSVDAMIQTIDNEKLPSSREPYATLLHNDLWYGNTMFRYSSSNQPTEVAFIDFQNTVYNSPARDVVYFLFTSVNRHMLIHFEEIILFYYQSFANCLSLFGCDTSEFTFTKLMDEINCYVPTKLKHMLLLFKALSGSTQHYDDCFKTHLKHIFSLFKDRHWL